MTIPLSLHRARILESLSEAEVEGLVSMGEQRSFETGQSVFREHEAADLLYILLEGRVKLSLRERGQSIEIARPTPGDHFGRMAMIEGQLCHTSAVGLTEGKLFVLSSMGCAALLARITRVRPPVPNITPLPSKAPELLELDPSAPPPSSAHIRSLSSMVAGVAHEINTPLGVIENAASFVAEQLSSLDWQKQVQDPEALETLSDVGEACRLIQKNVAHAARLIQSFKKLSVGQLAESREVVDLVRLVQETLNVFRAKTLSAVPPGPNYRGPRGQSGQHRLILASSRLDIDVVCTLTESERLWDGFPGLFSRVLLNLLTNIDRYAYPGDAPGKVEIKLERRAVARGPAQFELSVQDFGKGIAPADLPQIFEPFFTTGRDRGGTGLGLSMVHNLMTQGFNGSVRVQSVVGEGTRFDLVFPERAPDHTALMNAGSSREVSPSTPNA
ncbi:MAG: ATP-binding protein [Polyangiaceae bacterium]